MQSLASQDKWLFDEQKEGYIQTPEKGSPASSILSKLVFEDKIKIAFTRSGTTYYKLTRKGWDVIKLAKKILGL